MACHLIVPAAGSGSRLGRPEPKALVPLLGRAMLSWTLEALEPVGFERTVVAAPPDRLPEFQEVVRDRAQVVSGDSTRSGSVRRGFEALEADPDDLVCIHDAARPLITESETRKVLAAARDCGAATAASPLLDTVKRVAGGRILATIPREGLYATGTPQVFRAVLLERALRSGREATDEAGLLETLGIAVNVVPVSRWNLKVTTEEDVSLAEGLLRIRSRT